MGGQRIVSFLPSGTELLYELGAEDRLFGVTHECLYPDGAKLKPRIISSVFDSSKMNSKEIDKITTQLLKDGKEIFVLDERNLKDANPDLIISQNTCEVCAAHINQVNKAVQILENKPELLSMDPHNLQEILDSVTELATLLQKEEKGIQLRESLEKKINYLKEQNHDSKPNVLALEWIDPFFTAGHWVPEMIQVAGGSNAVSKTGEHSRRMDFQEAVDADPDIIIFMPCGFDTDRTISEYQKFLKSNERWGQMRAVKNNKVFAVDANSYFSKPSIRTITGTEILAKIIHPENFRDLTVPQNSYKVIG
jgi:iron complex transport system substrate-binding protein